jgi:hypothetical protein
VVQACGPRFLGGRCRRTVWRGQPWQKHENLSQKQGKSKMTGGMVQVKRVLPTRERPWVPYSLTHMHACTHTKDF